ncbi:hypothetical protein [Propionicimonas sp.]|uniref:hypothetical protein n=1 Tax=Propionicimonas sp. TaxID=1955623 RepID=UPI0025D3B235|nr:hypothetical protein [Propionicimonas sp.]MCG2806526.1 hypothetical protein [Propionicimonas sp.]
MSIRTWIVATLSAGLLAAALPAAPAQAVVTPLPASVTSCTGVWVVVDRGSDVSVRCAASHGTGLEALKSAGFTLETTTGSYGEFVDRINGFPEALDPSYTNYWGYWHATPNADGTWSAWTSSADGASNYDPKPGSVEGWHYGPYATTASFRQPPLGYAKKGTIKISGTAKVGKKLTAKVGTWSPIPKFTYRWYRGTKLIATKASYRLKKADQGKKIHVQVTATASNRQTVVLKSPATKKVRRK